MMNNSPKESFIEQIQPSVKDGSFVKMTFGKYKGGDSEFRSLSVKLINTSEGDKLSFNFSYKTRDVVKNFDIPAGISLINEITGKDFFTANLFTATKDFSIDYSRKHVPQLHVRKASTPSVVYRGHNREKNRIVDSSAKYFNLLGITSADGNVRADKYDKFRQVDKFIQIIDNLVKESGLLQKQQLRAVDLGSGKSYMTFALYDYLSNTQGLNATVTGIEQRKDLAEFCRMTAMKCRFGSLDFAAGTISEMNDTEADIVTALHACDTATDDAIVFALNAGASVIVLAPCCQKYLRRKLTIPDEIKPVFKFGIQEERLSVMLTDSLRALVLEYLGYETKVFEFISTEHTSRNTMITAVRRSSEPAKNNRTAREIFTLMKMFGLSDFYLDKALKLEFTDAD